MATSIVSALSVLPMVAVAFASSKIPVAFSVLMVAAKSSVLVAAAGPALPGAASPNVALLSTLALMLPNSLLSPMLLLMLILPAVPEPISDLHFHHLASNRYRHLIPLAALPIYAAPCVSNLAKRQTSLLPSFLEPKKHTLARISRATLVPNSCSSNMTSTPASFPSSP